MEELLSVGHNVCRFEHLVEQTRSKTGTHTRTQRPIEIKKQSVRQLIAEEFRRGFYPQIRRTHGGRNRNRRKLEKGQIETQQ